MKHIIFAFLLGALTACGGGGGGGKISACNTLDCRTAKYNLLLADVDVNAASPMATNITILVSSTYQDMTHPRVSPDKAWVAFTTYNVTNSAGCASPDSGYVDTEIKTVLMGGDQIKTIIPMTSGRLNSNNYWYGNNNEFTYLSGPPGSAKIYRAQTDGTMTVIAGPPRSVNQNRTHYEGEITSQGANLGLHYLPNKNWNLTFELLNTNVELNSANRNEHVLGFRFMYFK